MHAIMTKNDLYLFQITPGVLLDFTLNGTIDALKDCVKNNNYNKAFVIMHYIVAMSYHTDSIEELQRFVDSDDCIQIVKWLIVDPDEAAAFVNDACKPLFARSDSR